MDGVLADFAGAFQSVETDLFGPATTLPVEQPEEEEERQEKGIVQSRARRDAVWKEIQSRTDFWLSLKPMETGAVARLHQLSLAHRWEVFFITQRPATAGETVQRQTQRWLAAQGFEFPSVLSLAGARGAAIRSLRIDYHVDDSAQNCLDVIADATAKTILVAADLQAAGVANVRKLGIALASSPGQALDILEQATLANSNPSLLKRLSSMVGWRT